MWPLGVVMPDPLPNDLSGMGQIFKMMLPDALLLDGPDETLDQTILFGRVGCDEFLGQPIGFDGRGEAF